MLQTTYTDARANLASLCDEVTESQEIVVIRRRKGKSVAIGRLVRYAAGALLRSGSASSPP